GKTAAFALPILHRLGEPAGKPNAHGSKRGGTLPRALILCPTRELASQIGESFRTYGCNLNLRGTVIFGGVGHHRRHARPPARPDESGACQSQRD
ncbi:MAG TPA: DEAD/DEAH box helicase, partial [Phycisphaerales bacterium]|nr:DEAD/DEAH box helicase [Phycisphaerales bacterium]